MHIAIMAVFLCITSLSTARLEGGLPCVQLLQRLQQKRTALEKELGKVPGAPSSKKDVFHLCRGFERAFTHLLEVFD